ncbi:hypothetical protein JCM33374_g589 [Metschnikowia sp. JCM 33374]|nr:hypothetical protein JCM33374_g589 [Metschnikowia sp. JCM 33374]
MDVMEIKKISRSALKKIFYDTHKSEIIRPKVRPLEEQLDRESNKLWGATIRALSERNHALATEEKAKVENNQRQIAKTRLESGVEFFPRLFKKVQTSKSAGSAEGLEYVFFKDFDLRNDPEVLKEELFEIMPFLPGQTYRSDFETPASEKAS